MSRRISSQAYVGRVPELSRVAAILDEVASGASRTILVGGESGVGKSRFLGAIATVAADAGFDTATARCLSSSASLPFAGLREALRSLPEFDGDPDVAELVGSGREPEMGGVPQVDTPEHAIGPADPGVAQAAGRLFELCLGLLRAHAGHRPVLLAVDDLQWAPPSTLELFSYLVENPSTSRILVVGLHRTDIGRRHRLWSALAELGREPSVERIELGRLSPDEVRELAAAITGGGVDAEQVEALALRSGGIPLFVEELLASEAEVGRLPDTIRDVLRQRTLGVGENAQRVLRAAAVAGAEVDERLLAAVTGLAGAALWDPLRELVDGNLLVPDRLREASVYAFRHALVREAVVDDLLPGERVDHHARIAAYLDENPEVATGGTAGAAGEIADHWESALDPVRALPAHVDAGRTALRMFAHADAARHLDRAVVLWDRLEPGDRPSDERRPALVADAAEANGLAGRQQRAVELLRSALDDLGEQGDPLETAYLLDRLGQYLWEVGDDQGSVAARERALAVLPDERDLDRARIQSSLASVLVVSGRNDAAQRVATEALDAIHAAQRNGEPGIDAVEAGLRNTLGVLAAADGDVASATEQLLEARRIAESVGDPGERIRSYANLAAILGNAGRLAAALDVAEEGIVVAREVGLYRPYGQFLTSNALVALFGLGRWNEASRLVDETLAESSSGVIGAHLHLVSAQLSVGQGDLDSAERSLALAEDRAGRSEDPTLILELAATRAELQAWRGHPDEAWRTIEVARERISERPPPADLVVIGARVAADRAEQAKAHRRAAEIPAIRDGLERLVASLASGNDASDDSPDGRARATSAAELTRLDGEADADRFARAASMHEAAGLPYPTAYLRFRQAEAVLTQSRVRTQATDLLLNALATARALGARPLIGEIEALARRARIELPDPAAATVAAADAGTTSPADGLGLTEREVEVLALIAAGRTNRQIAEELFISPKTAGAHVSNIIGKLGVSGRVEAATIAERAGLTRPDAAASAD